MRLLVKPSKRYQGLWHITIYFTLLEETLHVGVLFYLSIKNGTDRVYLVTVCGNNNFKSQVGSLSVLKSQDWLNGPALGLIKKRKVHDKSISNENSINLLNIGD